MLEKQENLEPIEEKTSKLDLVEPIRGSDEERLLEGIKSLDMELLTTLYTTWSYPKIIDHLSQHLDFSLTQKISHAPLYLIEEFCSYSDEELKDRYPLTHCYKHVRVARWLGNFADAISDIIYGPGLEFVMERREEQVEFMLDSDKKFNYEKFNFHTHEVKTLDELEALAKDSRLPQ